MTEHDEDLELQAVQRQLDDAFQTTRPRRGFEDDLWLRMQASRPATSRLRDAIAGLLQGIREVPAVPAAAVATLLVVVIGVDQLASSLGAVLGDRPQGLLGSYSTSTYTLNIRPTIQRPVAGPTYFIISSPSMPPVDAAGAGPADVATIFLAQHSLVPDWAYAVKVDAGGDPVKVLYARHFDVPRYGAASLVDHNGDRYGVEVDLKGNRPILVTGM